jgi:cytosine/uracil/thiamine/allantoin permease
MNKITSLALVIIGAVLIIWGVSAMDSLSSDISNFFTGAPTNKAMWLLFGGIVVAIFGLFGTLRGNKKN